ncbi:MAG: SusC/RagA family TonB-linked outer membrane protein [Chitinophagaceae bacterium]|nr:SusC/RagA family TonB-linked outer membrane protein [Chitinophagaceae bacterium]
MRKVLLMLTAFLLFTGELLAQKTISGKVTDDKGAPVANVSVVVKGTNTGTTTKTDGTYTLSVPSTARTLVFSSIDMATQEVAIGSSSVISVTMSTVTKSMDEVIVVAYGTVKKGEYTGSSAQINAKDIENRPLTNVTNALVGSAPGIQTTTASGQPGSSPAIRLRGFGSINASSAPLIVVDGAPYVGGLANINPDDVESISTLKDASAAALYGSRGGNGVIQITTKKGRKNRNTLGFKVSHGFTSRAIPEYDQVDAFQYYPLMWESYRNVLVYRATNPIPIADANQLASGLFPRFTTGANAGRQNYNGTAYDDIYTLLGRYNPFVGVTGTQIVLPDGTLNPQAAQLKYSTDDLDWFKAFYRNGSRSDYGLNYSGGNEKSDYYGSFGYTKEKGFVTRSELERFNGRISINTQPVKWFRTGFNIAGSVINSDFPAEGGIVNPFSFARGMGPIYPVMAIDPNTSQVLLDNLGNPRYDYGNIPEVGARPVNQGRHAIYENILNIARWKRNILSGRAYGDVIFTKDLKFTTSIQYDVQDYQEESFENKFIGDGAPAGRASRTIEKNTAYTFNQLLNYSKKFGVHNVSALVGHESYKFQYNYFYGFKVDQLFDDGNTEFPNFATISNLQSQTDNHRIESYLSKLNYDFDGKYFFSGALRRDGNSRFYKDVRWSNFWSLGVGWRLDKEKFFNVTWVDQLKLRGSYGSTGIEAGIGYYPYQGLYGLGFNNNSAGGVLQTALPNYDLTWEASNSLDVGIDFSLLKGRLSGSAEFFNRQSKDLIFDVPQPLSNGGATGGNFSVATNIGSMYNRGFELQLIGEVFRGKDFGWTATLNATTFKNEVTKMPETPKEIISFPHQLAEGHSRYDFFLRDFYGVDPADGAALYRNVIAYSPANSRIFGKDTVTTLYSNARQVYAGKSSIPDVYGSFANTFRYKDISLTVLFTYQLGGYAYDNGYAGLMGPGSQYGGGQHVDILKRWQKAGDITNVPRMQNDQGTNFAGSSTRFLISATHLQLNSINLAYNLPKSFLSRIGADNARVFVSAENVYLFAKRKGMLVNQNFDGQNSNTYPPARLVTAGVNINF